MGQVLHGSARTTAAVRRAIQHSQESLRVLAKRHGLNPKTVAKWRARQTTADTPMGPRRPRSTVLTEAEEAAVAPVTPRNERQYHSPEKQYQNPAHKSPPIAHPITPHIGTENGAVTGGQKPPPADPEPKPRTR